MDLPNARRRHQATAIQPLHSARVATERRSADVSRTRPNQRPARILLDGMPDPPHAPAEREDDEWSTSRQPQRAAQRDEAKVYAGLHPQRRLARSGERSGTPP